MIRQLNINNFETYFILGNNSDEKLEKRRVIINIEIRFLDHLDACENDELSCTVCYSGLLNHLLNELKSAQFNLIERATKFVYDSVSKYVDQQIKSVGGKALKRIEVFKPKPPVENLESASFVCSDW